MNHSYLRQQRYFQRMRRRTVSGKNDDYKSIDDSKIIIDDNHAIYFS